MGKAKRPLMALWNIVSRLFVSPVFRGSKYTFPIISDIHPFSIVPVRMGTVENTALTGSRAEKAAFRWSHLT